jgi:two-component system, chemotaxis family, sensor kinase Cph1
VNSTGEVTNVPLRTSPLLGRRHASFVRDECQIPAGGGIVLISDGVVERRHEALQDGIDRLARELTRHGARPTAMAISTSVVDTNLHDDSAIVALYRDETEIVRRHH